MGLDQGEERRLLVLDANHLPIISDCFRRTPRGRWCTLRPRGGSISPYKAGAGGGGSVIGFTSSGFLTTLTVFLAFFLGAFFTCFFFPAIVRMPPLWVLYFQLKLMCESPSAGLPRGGLKPPLSPRSLATLTCEANFSLR